MKIFNIKLLFLFFALFLFQAASALASTVTIAQTQINNWRYGGGVAKLRVFPNQKFTTSDGEIILAGSVTRASWYKEISCTISGTVLTIPQFTIDSTMDSSVGSATYTAILYDSRNIRRDDFLANFKVPVSLGTTVSWAQITSYLTAVFPVRDFTTYTKDQIDQLLAGLPLGGGTGGGSVTSVAGKTGIITLTKSDVGLANADNTADVDKPTSTLTLTRLSGKVDLTSKGAINGVASLDSAGKVPLTQIPGGVVGGGGGSSSAETVVATISELQAAINAANAAPASSFSVQINGGIAFAGDTTIPKNIQIQALNSGVLSVGNGVTVTIAQEPVAGRRKIFNLTGTGKVIFGTQVHAYPQWWGAVDDAANIQSGAPTGTDNTLAIQSALESLNQSGGGVLDVSSRYGFVLAGSLSLPNIRSIKILGNAGIYDYSEGTRNLIFTGDPTNGDGTQADLMRFETPANLSIENVGFYYTNNAFTGSMLVIGGLYGDGQYFTARNSSFSGRSHPDKGGTGTASALAGIKFETVINQAVDHCGFYNMQHGIVNNGYANIIAVRDSLFISTSGYPILLTSGAESWDITGNNFENGFEDPANGKNQTRALKVVGSAWSINFSHNWMGDGGTGLTTDDPFVSFSNTYGVSVINNRFANSSGSQQYGVAVSGSLAVTAEANRFDGINAFNFNTAASYGVVLEANDVQNGGMGNVSGFVGVGSFVGNIGDSEGSRTLGGFLVLGSGGNDKVGASPTHIGFGSVSGTDIFTPQANRYGGGIRMTSNVPPFTDGSMIFTTRADTDASYAFYTNNNQRFKIDSVNVSNAPLKIGAGGTAQQLVASASATLDFGATPANSCEDLDLTGFANLTDGDVVSLGIPSLLASSAGGTSFTGFVKTASVVTVRRCNAASAAAADPAAAIVRAEVTHF